MSKVFQLVEIQENCAGSGGREAIAGGAGKQVAVWGERHSFLILSVLAVMRELRQRRRLAGSIEVGAGHEHLCELQGAGDLRLHCLQGNRLSCLFLNPS